MKKTALFVIAFMLCFCSNSFAAIRGSIRGSIRGAIRGNAQSFAEKEWTLAVFLNADNNLDQFGYEDQVEMSKVGSNENLNIVTLIDRVDGPAQINYIEKNNIKKIKDIGELDMGDYNEFVKFAKFVKENYPAKHYIFSIWNHGSGWKKRNESGSTLRGISYDDSTHNNISTNELGIAFEEINKILGKKVDLLIFDACLMQMVEVAYAIRKNVNYIVASEDVEPGKGAPYEDIVKLIKKGVTPKELAIKWTNAFADSYENGSLGKAKATQSALDMSKFSKLIDGINGFAKAAMSGRDYSKLFKFAHFNTQKYEYNENIDLVHFMNVIKSKLSSADSSLSNAIDKLISAVNECVICNRFTAEEVSESHGIAIWFSNTFYVPWLYQDLDFAKECLWDDMVNYIGDLENINKVIDEAKSGNLESLNKMVYEAEINNTKKAYYKRALEQLNFVSETERAIPSEAQSEFNRLLDNLSNQIK